MMIKLFAVAALITLAGSVSAAPIIPPVSFGGYTIGDLSGQNSWDVSSGGTTNPIQVQAGDVIYAGLDILADDRSVVIANNGQDLGLSFDLQATDAGTTLYYSMTVTITDTATFVTPGGYFAHFTEGTAPGGTAFRGRLWVDEVGTTAPQIGVDATSGDTPAMATAVSLTYGTPIFVVVKLTYNSGTADDTAEVFVNKAVATEPAADAIDSGVDFSAIGRIGIRQDSTTETPSVVIDNIRVGTTWDDVVVLTGGVSDWMMVN